jgi:CheY-like chemotaxis protein
MASPARAAAGRAAERRSSGRRRTAVDRPPDVLVVEDDPDLREGLRALIEEWGHAVEVAETGAAGVERAVAGRPRVALVDIGLPEVSGFDVAQRIRSLLDRKEITLVALTGRSEPEDLERALACGFDAHLSKPIPFERLRTLLTERLSAGNEIRRPG